MQVEHKRKNWGGKKLLTGKEKKCISHGCAFLFRSLELLSLKPGLAV